MFLLILCKTVFKGVPFFFRYIVRIKFKFLPTLTIFKGSKEVVRSEDLTLIPSLIPFLIILQINIK